MGKIDVSQHDAKPSELEEQSSLPLSERAHVAPPQQVRRESRLNRAAKISLHAIVIILCVLFIKSVIYHRSDGHGSEDVVPLIDQEPGSKIPPKTTADREITVHTNSASVTGTYALYDLLSITSISGSIDITVDPQPISVDHPKPAVLRVSTNSGSIRVRTLTSAVPDRIYESTIASRSGQLEVNIIHGKQSTVRTENGQIKADIYPYGFNDTRSSVDARTNSGSIGITLHSSLSHPAIPLKKLHSLYRTSSGSIDVFYPAQWQGIVEGSTGSGSVSLEWDGLRVGMFARP